jgi:hypothetical protein
MNELHDDLVESIASIIEKAEWALATDWSKEILKGRIAGILAQARYALDQAKEVAFERLV